MDQVSPALMPFLVWSWAPAQPFNLFSTPMLNVSVCGYINGTDGRWYSLVCDSVLSMPSICRNSQGSLVVSNSNTTWNNCTANCATHNMAFSYPKNGQETMLLLSSLKDSNAWINIRVDSAGILYY